MITYVVMDVTSPERGVIAHGCNCQGVMGSGVALSVRTKWPVAYQRYHQLVEHHVKAGHPTSELLGLAQIINVGHELLTPINTLYVSNMFTQNYFGRDGKVYADPTAIKKALEATVMFCSGSQLPLYIPRIGCGLGGLSWDDDVEPIIRECDRPEVEIFVCDQPT